MQSALALAEDYYDNCVEHELIDGKAYPRGGDGELRYERINGMVVIYAMAGASTPHNLAKGNIYHEFRNRLAGKRCVPISDGEDVYLDKDNRFIPDVMIVCDPEKIKDDGVHGAPDLVAEVLSPGTAVNDKTVKLWVYGKCGVKEYWIVDPRNCLIEVYRLGYGKYGPPATYILRSPLTPQEIKVSLCDDFTVPLEAIFERVRDFGE